MLGDFGMSAPKATGTRTVEAKAKAVAQSLATREARHTMGKKEKARADFDEPFGGLGTVELAAVA